MSSFLTEEKFDEKMGELTCMIKVSFDHVATQISELNQRVGNIEVRVGNIEQRFGNIEVRVEKIEQRVGNIEIKVESIAIKVDNTDGNVTGLKQQLLRHMQITDTQYL